MKVKTVFFFALVVLCGLSGGVWAADNRGNRVVPPRLEGGPGAAPREVPRRQPTIGPRPVTTIGPAAGPLDQPAQALEHKRLEFSVKQVGPLFEVKGASTQVIGQGGNYAVAAGPGKILWFLNNIWIGELPSSGQPARWGIIEGGVALSASTSPYSLKGALDYVQDENRWPISFLSSDFREYIPVRKFWPRAGLKTEKKYYVFYSILNNFGNGPYDYFRVGQGLAFSDNPEGPYKKMEIGGMSAFWSDVEPAFGSAAFSDSDGQLYVYGRVMTEPGKYTAALSRVKPGDIESREKYEYYSLDASSGVWTSDLTEVTPVMENMPEEFSVSYNEYLKSYLALYLDIEDAEVLLMRSDYPWGQWRAPVKIMACSKEDYCSGAKEQPLFSLEDGKRIFFTLEKKNMPYIYELTFK
ncbi:MAG TPA: hypothetical protein DCL44_06745 [Elusimicrobia bacterium]|nr:hypothetical protein [Elusimicrobiota bacterium]